MHGLHIGDCRDILPTLPERSVWTVATQAFREAHFATFPQAIEPCVLAGAEARIRRTAPGLPLAAPQQEAAHG